MNEFNLITRYFQGQGIVRHDVLAGIGDDCALLLPVENQVLAVTTDTLVAGVHFLPDVQPADLGYKALAVNLSDLAAMGAEPAWVSLAITLPSISEFWLEEFCKGFIELAQQYKVQLIGGDTTQGPLAVTITAHGFVPGDKVLRRNAAKPGDKVYVTGCLGDAGAGLRILQDKLPATDSNRRYLLSRLYKPSPKIAEGLKLRGIAHAAIDISDGLAADVNHILAQSHVGARLYVDKLPLSSQLSRTVDIAYARQLALTAGDDYELCFTLSQANQSMLEQMQLVCTCIGEIEQQPGLRLQLTDGRPYDLPQRLGYQHFG